MININLLNKQLSNKNLNIYQLSKITMITQQTLHMIFDGRIVNPHIDTVVSICDTLDIKIEDVIIRKEVNSK